MRRPVKADLMPWFARALSSAPRYSIKHAIQGARAKIRGEQDLARVFINPRDPFGLPLLQALTQVQKNYWVRFRLHTVWRLDDDMFPEPTLWRNWAQQDASRLANLYDFMPPDRPVLPMLMRGQSVPDAKKWYIFHDTKREANKLGIPYGFVADPLGAGVERCYALFEYALSLGREIDYMRTYARAVNAEGIRSETDAGLKVIVERVGLDWQKARTLLDDESWRDWAEDNRQAMYECGLWGVPSFR